jgi:pyruvate/2-oxoglutarate dehydrogenase complex dihydrolipoamide acyltransferase (E2) component
MTTVEILAQNPTDGPPESLVIHEVFVQLNDVVKVGQLLFIAEGAKVIVDVESHVNGRVSRLNITAGEEVEIGRVLMEIETAEEK